MISTQISIFAFYASRVILVILIGLSIFTLAFFIERMIYFLRNFLKNDATLFSSIEKAATKEEIRDVLQSEARAESVVILNSFNTFPSTKDDFAKKVRAHLNIEKEKWEKFISFLGTVGSNAPFIGLLGTVLGIMKSFADLGSISKGGPQVVMSGISEALVATAVGLAVAIPAIIFFNILKTKIKKSVTRVETLTELISSKNIF